MLLDVGVETTLKTYLLLDQAVSKAKSDYPARKKAASGNFHALLKGVKTAAGPQLRGLDLSHIKFHHECRNEIYHQANGLTVPTKQAEKYATLAQELLKILLKVDLDDDMKIERQKDEDLKEKHTLINQYESQIMVLREAIDAHLYHYLELVDESLLLPRTARQLNKYHDSYRIDGNRAVFDNDLVPENIRQVYINYQLVPDFQFLSTSRSRLSLQLFLKINKIKDANLHDFLYWMGPEFVAGRYPNFAHGENPDNLDILKERIDEGSNIISSLNKISEELEMFFKKNINDMNSDERSSLPS